MLPLDRMTTIARSVAVAAATTLAALTGCAIPGAPPPMSAARLVRLPLPAEPAAGAGEAATHGNVGASAGLLFAADDNGGTLYSIMPEAGAGLWLHDMYDLTVAVDPYQLSLEGDLVLLRTPALRLGILHGVGGGLVAELADSSGGTRVSWWLAHLTAGVFAQVASTPAGAAFAAVKYTYSTSSDTDTIIPTHYLSGSLGYLFRVGALRVAPEVALSYGRTDPTDPMASASWFFLIIPGVSVSAGF